MAVRGGGERGHEGNLADARTQPNNLTHPYKILSRAPPKGSALVVLTMEIEAQDGGRTEKRHDRR